MSRPRALTDKHLAEIADRRAKGETLKDLAEEFGVTPRGLRKALKRNYAGGSVQAEPSEGNKPEQTEAKKGARERDREPAKGQARRGNRPPKPWTGRLPTEKITAIKAVYARTGNLSATAREVGCSSTTVKRYVEDPGTALVIQEEQERSDRKLLRKIKSAERTAAIKTAKQFEALKNLGVNQMLRLEAEAQDFTKRALRVEAKAEAETDPKEKRRLQRHADRLRNMSVGVRRTLAAVLKPSEQIKLTKAARELFHGSTMDGSEVGRLVDAALGYVEQMFGKEAADGLHDLLQYETMQILGDRHAAEQEAFEEEGEE